MTKIRTNILGYPRIGAHRELKRAEEAYWAGKISRQELLDTAALIRKENWQLQKEAGIDLIPSNDFSFYDGMLDTAFLLNAVPERYTSLGLSTLDTFFAAARGYQGEKGDVKALAMKKWYNTNYHYMVPEVSDSTDIKLEGTEVKTEFYQASMVGNDLTFLIFSASVAVMLIMITVIAYRRKRKGGGR